MSWVGGCQLHRRLVARVCSDASGAGLERAHLVVVLLSADFLASDYAYGVELTRALELHRGRRLTLVPVVVRNCAWRTLPLRALQALPDGARPIDSWPRREDAL